MNWKKAVQRLANAGTRRLRPGAICIVRSSDLTECKNRPVPPIAVNGM